MCLCFGYSLIVVDKQNRLKKFHFYQIPKFSQDSQILQMWWFVVYLSMLHCITFCAGRFTSQSHHDLKYINKYTQLRSQPHFYATFLKKCYFQLVVYLSILAHQNKKDSFFILLWIFWQIKHKEWEELALWQRLKIFGSISAEKSIPHGKGIFCSLQGHIIGLRGPVLQIPYTKLPWNSSINLIFRCVTQREKATTVYA